MVAEWLAGGAALAPHAKSDDITVLEVAARFWQHAQTYYRRADGRATSELGNFRNVLRVLKDHYGHVRASEFGPRALKTVRECFVAKDLARHTVNSAVRRIRQVFKWAVAEELVDASVYQALQAVDGLRRGRTSAREARKVRPVAPEVVERVRPYVSRQVWAVICLQQLTAARSDEILSMRPCDVDREGEVWIYRPEQHKSLHRGQAREIFLGPKAQETTAPFLSDRPPMAYCFSSREAERERLEKRHAGRCTPLGQGNAPGTNRREVPKRRPGDRYRRDSYAHAVARACERAGVERFHPHQLRHAAATKLRREFGVDAARIILGHRSVSVTDTYAELDAQQAVEIAKRIG